MSEAIFYISHSNDFQPYFLILERVLDFNALLFSAGTQFFSTLFDPFVHNPLRRLPEAFEANLQCLEFPF